MQTVITRIIYRYQLENVLGLAYRRKRQINIEIEKKRRCFKVPIIIPCAYSKTNTNGHFGQHDTISVM